jgi:D-serine deaminase-like pyridoxal phosphate-dependent protein
MTVLRERTLHDPCTPFAVLDYSKMSRNIDRLGTRAQKLGVTLRPHLKTAKSIPVASSIFAGGAGPITVSTMAEAEAFADAGFKDIVYAVGLAPDKLDRVFNLLVRDVDLAVLVDSRQQAEAINRLTAATGQRIPTLIEIDCDGHRGGLEAGDPELVQLGLTLHGAGNFRGVLTHAGGSYSARSQQALVKAAENECDVANRAAEMLRNSNVPCSVVSIGSTPTAHTAMDLKGVTELRAGNYVFFDLVMAGLGVCETEDIALSIVVTVIGHRHDKGWTITDGGWMAVSRDRGTENQRLDQGYGVVTSLGGAVVEDLIVAEVTQEHGILALRSGSRADVPHFAVGTRLRVLPNHACATAAQHAEYEVVRLETSPGDKSTSGATIDAVWPRVSGW